MKNNFILILLLLLSSFSYQMRNVKSITTRENSDANSNNVSKDHYQSSCK